MEQVKQFAFLAVFFVLVYFLIRKVKASSKIRSCLGYTVKMIWFSVVSLILFWLIWDFVKFYSFDNQIKSRFENAQPNDVVSIELDERYPGWESMNLVDSAILIQDPQSLKAIFRVLKSGEKLFLHSDHRHREWDAILTVRYRDSKTSEFQVEYVENGNTYFRLMRDLNEFEGRDDADIKIINDTELGNYKQNDLNLILRRLARYKGRKSI